MGGVFKLALRRESVFLKPLKKPFAKGRNHIHLNKVDMGIYEAGNDQLFRVINDFAIIRQSVENFGVMHKFCHATISQDQHTVFNLLNAAVDRVFWPGSERKCRKFPFIAFKEFPVTFVPSSSFVADRSMVRSQEAILAP